jgi:hypothetical protein
VPEAGDDGIVVGAALADPRGRLPEPVRRRLVEIGDANVAATLEDRVTRLDALPARIDSVALQIVQLRSEMHGEFSAVRAEIRELREAFVEVRQETRQLNEETRRQMREEDEKTRLQMREEDEKTRLQMRELNDETRRHMLMLHEEVIGRIALLREGLAGGQRQPRKKRKS